VRISFEGYPVRSRRGAARSCMVWLVVATVLCLCATLAVVWYFGNSTAEQPDPAAAVLAELDLDTLQKLVSQLEARAQKASERQARFLPRAAAIMVDSAENLIYLFQGSRLVVQGKCSTGTGLELTDTEGNRTWTFDTPRGYFRVLSKVTDPVWYRPDWAFVEEGEPIPRNAAGRAMPDVLGDYALGFGDGYFIHGTLYTRLLGSSVTHGCIRVDDDVLKKIFDTAKPGTPIWIY